MYREKDKNNNIRNKKIIILGSIAFEMHHCYMQSYFISHVKDKQNIWNVKQESN